MISSTLRDFLFPDDVSDLLKKTTQSLSLVILFFGPPFIIQDIVAGTYTSGIILSLITFSALVNVWTISRHNRYYPAITLLIMLPLFLWFNYHVIFTEGIHGILWSYPFLVGFYFALPERMSWIASICCLSVTTYASLQVFDAPIAARVFISSFIVCLYIALLVRIINKQHDTLETQANHDPLTGLLNRKTLQTRLEHAIQTTTYGKSPASLLCIDLDNFKRINDSHGHQVGDDVLVKLAKLLQQYVNGHLCTKRSKLFRIGGEEFLLLLQNKDMEQASVIAEELRQRIASHPLLPEGDSVTASIGVSEYKKGSTWTQWMNHADYTMYHAKDAGRNCVMAHEPLSS